MSRKQELIADLRAVYEDWDQLLTAGPDKELASQRITSKWVLKDVVAHVMAWQQLSIARLEAAIAGGDPELPAWVGGADPSSEEHLHELNATIHATYQAMTWPDVHRAWRTGFARLLELAEAIPEEALLDAGRYAWLRGYALSDVLKGSCEHHREHLDAALRALSN